MYAYSNSEEGTTMEQSPVSHTSPIFIENLLKKFQFPLPVNVKQTSFFGSNIFPTIHAHISICIAFLVLAIMLLLTNNRAEHIPSPRKQISKKLII